MTSTVATAAIKVTRAVTGGITWWIRGTVVRHTTAFGATIEEIRAQTRIVAISTMKIQPVRLME
ncbi:hypothetical protein TPCV302_07320 [Cutibacterium avidum]|nr:hypothetical protein TPCV302_07320 [Cutibacterium avidum]